MMLIEALDDFLEPKSPEKIANEVIEYIPDELVTPELAEGIKAFTEIGADVTVQDTQPVLLEVRYHGV